MKRKRIALGATVVFGSLVVAIAACSSGDDNAAPSNTSDASQTSDVSNSDAQTIDASDAAADPACFDLLAAVSFTTAPLAPSPNPGKCNDGQITQFSSICVPVLTTTDNDAAVFTDCNTFANANLDCSKCLGYDPARASGDAGTAPFPWPTFETPTPTTIVPSVSACVAALSTASPICKSAYAATDFCAQSSCEACSASDLQSCITAEDTSSASYCWGFNGMTPECLTAIGAVSPSDAASKCGVGTAINTTSDFNAVFAKVAKTLCE